MDNEVKPTWRFAWGLWWRWFLISLGISLVVGVIVALVAGVSILSWFIPW
ncbi:MAG: hypothetical protein ACXQTH_02345 [Dehalococcoidia bacterium]